MTTRMTMKSRRICNTETGPTTFLVRDFIVDKVVDDELKKMRMSVFSYLRDCLTVEDLKMQQGNERVLALALIL